MGGWVDGSARACVCVCEHARQRPYRPFATAVHVLNDLGAFMLVGMHAEPQVMP